MRKSRTRAGFRPLRVGIAATATAAAVVAGSATSAFAAGSITTSPSPLPAQGGATLTITGSGTSLAGSDEPYFIPSTGTCGTKTATLAANSTATAATGYTAGSGTAATLVTPALAMGSWKLCIFAADGSLSVGGSAAITVVPFGTLSTVTGTTAGGNAITMTYPSLIGTGTAVGTIFTTGSCPDKYTTTSVIAATTTKKDANTANITVPATLAANTGYNVCVFNGATANTSTLLAKSAATYGTYATALPALTVTPSGGSSGGTNYLTLGTTANTISGSSPGVSFTKNSCPAAYNGGASTDPYEGTVTKISSSKVAVQVPTGVVVTPLAATSPWQVCLYATNTSGALITQPATYTVAPVLDVSGATTTTTAGPAQGGTTVTFEDLSGIPVADGATLKASLGGSPLTNVKANSDESITGVTTSHAPGVVTLSVTTAAGTQTTDDIFTYNYGITVNPNLLPYGEDTTIDITGAGFGGLDFGTPLPGGLTADDAHVILTDNNWNNQDFSSPARRQRRGCDQRVRKCSADRRRRADLHDAP